MAKRKAATTETPAAVASNPRLDKAMAETLIIDAMVRADGWRLEQFMAAPQWLKHMYNCHADAAYAVMQKLQKPTERTDTH